MTARPRSLLGHAQRRGGVTDVLRVGAPEQRRRRLAEPAGHHAVGVQPRTRGRVLHDQARLRLLDQRRRERRQPFGQGGGQRDGIGHPAMVATTVRDGRAAPRGTAQAGLVAIIRSFAERPCPASAGTQGNPAS